MPCSVNIRKGNAWHRAVKVFIHKAGAWHEAVSTSIHKGGAWHTCSSAPPVVPDKPLTGDIEKLLRKQSSHTHTNSKHTVTMEQQPADKVFPDGQKVYVGGYQTDDALLQKAADSGFTVTGYHGVYKNSFRKAASAKKHGLMYAPLIRELNSDGGGDQRKFGCYIDGSMISAECMGARPSCSGVPRVGQAAINKVATDAMKKWQALDDNNIYGWLYCLDDCRTRNKTSHSNSLYHAMMQADPKKRTVGDFGLADSYEDTAAGRARLQETTWTISQNYYHGGDFTGDGDGFHGSRAIIGNWATILKSNCNAVASNNGKARLITQGWIVGFAWNVVPEENSDPAYFRRQFLHDSLLALMKGCNGLHFYQMRMAYGSGHYGDRPLYCCQSEKTIRLNAIFWATKLINKDHDVAKALVWGKRTGHSKAISVSGTNTYRYGHLGHHTGAHKEYTENMINHQDIQFNHKRYVIVTNSTPTKEVVTWWRAHPHGVVSGKTHNPAPAAVGCNTCRTTFSDTTRSFAARALAVPPKYNVPVTLSGFPYTSDQLQQYVVTELVSGTVVRPNSSGQIHTTMAPLESRIYEIKPAPGYIGGSGTVPPGTPENQLPYASIPSAVRSWIQNITHDAHPADIQPSDYRFTNRSRGEVYAYQDANHVIFYWPHGGDANFNFHSFADHADVHWMAGNGQKLNQAIGSAEAISYHDGTHAGATVYKKVSGGSGTAKPHVSTPNAVTVAVGAKAVFSTVLTGTGTLLWQYSINGHTWHSIPTSTGLTHTITSAALTQNGTLYRVTAHNSAGDFTSGSAKLTVHAAAVKPTITGPADINIKVGQAGTFKIVAQHYTNLHWQWKKPGTTAWIDLPDKLPSHPTQVQTATTWNGSLFRCTATGPGGSTTSRNAVLHVAAAFHPAITTAVYVNKYPWVSTITFNGTVRIVNASLIRMDRWSSVLGKPASSWGYSKNAAASGNQLTIMPTVPAGTPVPNQYILIPPGAITVNGTPNPKIEQQIVAA